MEQPSEASTPNGLEAEIHSLVTSFLFEVREATAMLMYGLAGVDVYRNASLPQKELVAVPELNGVSLYPTILRTTPYHQRGPQVSPEQIVYTGWVDHVYGLWEHKYRNALRAAFEASSVDDAIRPEVPVMGDFRHVRNDFVHGGVATAEHSGLCTTLRWFTVGDDIALNFGHVMDFLNHIGALGRELRVTEGETRIHLWRLRGGEEQLLRAEPALVSARLSDEGPVDGSLHVNLAFENGVFGQISFTFPDETAPKGGHDAEVSEDGSELLIDNGAFMVPARDLYTRCVEAWFHPEQTVKGPGMSEFLFRFR